MQIWGGLMQSKNKWSHSVRDEFGTFEPTDGLLRIEYVPDRRGTEDLSYVMPMFKELIPERARVVVCLLLKRDSSLLRGNYRCADVAWLYPIPLLVTYDFARPWDRFSHQQAGLTRSDFLESNGQ